MKIGKHIYRFRWPVLAAWGVLLAAALAFVPSANPSANELTSFLPAEHEYEQSIAMLAKSFPTNSGLSQAVVIFERTGTELTPQDLQAVEAVAARIPRPGGAITGADLAGVTVRSPRSLNIPDFSLTSGGHPINPLISQDRRAALIMVNIPANFVTIHSSKVVEHIRTLLHDTRRPDGLAAAVTGSSGFGHDYAQAAEASSRTTTRITIAAVIVILLLVYRAPLAALVPLLAISLAAVLSLRVLGFCEIFGMHAGTAEQIFVIVLLYGAGVDYSLLLISRYRERIESPLASPAQAAAEALDASFPAILAAAGTNVLGIFMLVFAQFGIFRTTGPAVAVALSMALLSAVTLVPALIAIFGPALFWPFRPAPAAAGGMARFKFWVWPKLAAAVVRRPALVMLVTLGALALPVFQGSRVTWLYDTLATFQAAAPGSVGNAAAGVEMVQRHWPVGEIAPVTLLVRAETPQTPEKWSEVAADLTREAARFDEVRNVRSLTWPLGKDQARASVLAAIMGGSRVRSEYVSPDQRAMRLEVVLSRRPLNLGAMDQVRQLRMLIQQRLPKHFPTQDSTLYVTGATAEILATRDVTNSDFRLISILVLGVIVLVVMVLLRDAFLSLFMVGSTLLSYFVTLGIAEWFFTVLLGQAGLDWKVRIFLFVVIAAVGVDYNLFLVARLSQEARELAPREAIRLALVHTGPVISSCGLIMAATLGSLAAGELLLLKQLGFALATGMLIDTFVTRPLLLPSFVALTGKTGKGGGLGRT